MKNDFHSSSSSRSNYRAKRKKTNLILNGLIVIVLLLIAIVAYTIFSTGNDKASSTKKVQKTEAIQSLHNEKSKKKDQEAVANDSKGSNASDENSQSGDTSTSDVTGENGDDSQAVSTDGDSTETTQTIENPDWKPAGTTQSGEHAANYDSSSTDWQEMLNAISSATGLDQSNMTVWFLGRDKNTTNGSVGTVSSKDKQQKYRVYIQWVDGQGWKPTKVEQLTEVSNGN